MMGLHNVPAGQLAPPQLMERLHASVMKPHVAPTAAHAAGSVEQAWLPAWHTWVPVQLPQLRVCAQPFWAGPQWMLSCVQSSGVHPHWSGVPPPPQESGAGQLPQLSVW
jgi:hypothetical protein